MNRSRLIRCLRITVSAVCVTVCVALIGLWIRSLSYCDIVFGPSCRERMLAMVSIEGRLSVGTIRSTSKDIFPKVLSGWTLQSDDDVVLEGDIAYFEFSSDPNDAYVAFPYGLPALIFSTLAFAPWLPWSTRFSLRTMLIVTTLVAMTLGFLMWLAQP